MTRSVLRLLGLLAPLGPGGLPALAPAEHLPVACSCREGAEHWGRFREAAVQAFTPDFPQRMLDRDDAVHRWLVSLPCPDLNWQPFRGMAALSDCAPGVILVHVACSQRLLLELRFLDALDQLIEALQALPFAEACLKPSSEGGAWPVTALDVHTNYVRVYRALSYYELTPLLVPDLAWRPSRNCISDRECAEGEICSSHRCVIANEDCVAGDSNCPSGATCTESHSPSGTDCVLSLSPICILDGEMEAFHPRNACLTTSSYPRMIKACSEMGTTLYSLRWSSVPYEERVKEGFAMGEQVSEGGGPASVMLLPVTLRLQSPWHTLHSLVPAYSQARVHGRYGLLPEQGGPPALVIVDQDLDKDRHIWDKVLGEQNTNIGSLDFLLRLISPLPYDLLADIRGPRCYQRAIWGHELMLYSGGGWVDNSHVNAFANAARSLVDTGAPSDSAASRRLLLVERRNATAWGRWIDNFADVRALAEAWAERHTELLADVQTADLAELAVAEQLRLAAGVRVMFGAHGDGLTWSTFMGAGGALIEAVPGRDMGFQACVEGIDENPRGIFGGLARLAKQTHICFLNAQSKISSTAFDEVDVFQWSWRKMNMHIDLGKFEQYLSVAVQRVHEYDSARPS